MKKFTNKHHIIIVLVTIPLLLLIYLSTIYTISVKISILPVKSSKTLTNTSHTLNTIAHPPEICWDSINHTNISPKSEKITEKSKKTVKTTKKRSKTAKNGRKSPILGAKMHKLPPGKYYISAYINSPTYLKEKGWTEEEILIGRLKCIQYVNTWKKIAIEEQKKGGVLASITLAQGLYESNAGESKLALASNNHFGIKCPEWMKTKKVCKEGHCTKYADDNPDDRFRNFASPKESFIYHTIFLQKSRYKKVINNKSYKSSAKELKKAGYATSKTYATKIIKVIESMNLHIYDRL